MSNSNDPAGSIPTRATPAKAAPHQTHPTDGRSVFGERPVEVGHPDADAHNNGQHSVSGDFDPTPNSGQRQKMVSPEAYDQVIRQNKVTPPSRPTVMGTGEPDKRKR